MKREKANYIFWGIGLIMALFAVTILWSSATSFLQDYHYFNHSSTSLLKEKMGTLREDLVEVKKDGREFSLDEKELSLNQIEELPRKIQVVENQPGEQVEDSFSPPVNDGREPGSTDIEETENLSEDIISQLETFQEQEKLEEREGEDLIALMESWEEKLAEKAEKESEIKRGEGSTNEDKTSSSESGIDKENGEPLDEEDSERIEQAKEENKEEEKASFEHREEVVPGEKDEFREEYLDHKEKEEEIESTLAGIFAESPPPPSTTGNGWGYVLFPLMILAALGLGWCFFRRRKIWNFIKERFISKHRLLSQTGNTIISSVANKINYHQAWKREGDTPFRITFPGLEEDLPPLWEAGERFTIRIEEVNQKERVRNQKGALSLYLNGKHLSKVVIDEDGGFEYSLVLYEKGVNELALRWGQKTITLQPIHIVDYREETVNLGKEMLFRWGKQLGINQQGEVFTPREILQKLIKDREQGWEEEKLFYHFLYLFESATYGKKEITRREYRSLLIVWDLV